jgi:hypothetical protein
MPVNKVNAAWSSGDLVFKNASKVAIATLANTGASLSRKRPVELITGDATIGITEGIVLLSKGSAAAITLSAPTTGTDDGKVLHIRSETAQAHVISYAFNGAAVTAATLGGAIADGVSVIAYLGVWWVLENVNATIA